MNLGKILVLAPHRDDEILGCGGTLAQHSEIWIHYFNSVHPNVEQKQYDLEAEAVRSALKARATYSSYQEVNNLEKYGTAVYVDEIEKIINYYNPDTLFIPAPSYNQDHRHIYNAAITACRVHDFNYLVKRVLLYEQPETHTPAYATFNPQLFVEININMKIGLYQLYASQVKAHRSTAHIEALAKVRGMQSGYKFAEAFQIVREIS